MKLNSIKIENFRSIKDIEFENIEIKKSYTNCLLGINESGKSSILKAIDFYDSKLINYPNDFYDNSKSVYVQFDYTIDKKSLDEIIESFEKKFKLPEEIKKAINIKGVKIRREHSTNGENKLINKFDKALYFENYTFVNNEFRIRNNDAEKAVNFEELINEIDPDLFWKFSHKIILWRSTTEYLILDSIDLIKFAEKPKEVSIPLLNCFKLINIEEEDIKSNLNKLNTPNAIYNLQSKLGEAVTKHIKNTWPEHPINIRFQIDNQKITFLIEDVNVSHSVKTTEQRSNGFKQFISFLLTVSIDNLKDELENTILLIDEPEVHLHPPAQINLLKELIRITSNSKNNIVFFATHSNYMIDKVKLNRCISVKKTNNDYTTIQKLIEKSTTYAEVNFEIFEIPTNDYHNELYGYLEDVNKEKLNALPKNKVWHNEKYNKDENISLAKYIRHSIHHPENNSNKIFTDAELKRSINTLRKLKYK